MRIGKLAISLAMLFIAATVTRTAHGAIVIDMLESGSDVVGTLSGTLNLGGLSGPSTFNESASSATGPGPLRTRLRIGPTTNTSFSSRSYAIAGAPDWRVASLSFAEIQASAGSGTLAGIEVADAAVYIGVPNGFSSGGSLSSTSTWSGQSFASMNLKPGSYTYTWAGDSLTVNIGPVPEPGTGALVAIGAACLGGGVLAARLRRRRGKN